jgi:competence protein ComGC
MPSRVHHDDDGLTLVDVLTSMAIMTVVMALFTSGIVQMYRMVNGTDAKSVAQTQVSVALLRLDRDVRYAAGISTTGPNAGVSSSATVDYLVRETKTVAGALTVVPNCKRVRVLGTRLQQVVWPLSMTDVTRLGTTYPWTTLATGITSPAPFTYRAPTAEVSYQRLTVTLQATSGSGSTAVHKHSTVTYTALNTTTRSSNDDCALGR